MRNLFPLFCINFIGINFIYSQESLNASGGNAFGSLGSSSYSIGQVAYSNSKNTNGSYNQGVQQPYEITIIEIDKFYDVNLCIEVYPNPTSSNLLLNVESQDRENLSYKIYDINGNILLDQKINQLNTIVPMQELIQGTYILKVVKNHSIYKSFIITKNHSN